MGIEMIAVLAKLSNSDSHTPRGVWGLKSVAAVINSSPIASYPARGMGIEIPETEQVSMEEESYPARGMGIEILHYPLDFPSLSSHTPRGVWGLKSRSLHPL